jgi:hypothetical protein
MSINKNIADKVEKQLQKYINDAMQQGVDLDTLSPEQLKMIVQINKPKPPRVIAADSPEGREITEKLFGKRGEVVDMAGKKLDTSQGIMGGKSVKELMDSGQVTKGARDMKKSKKVTDREMFKAANKRLTSDVDSIIKNIKSMEPVTAMKEASSVIGRKGKYKNLTEEQSKKILQDTEDHIFERNIPEDPEDFAQGGIARANFVGGGMGRRGFLKMLAGLGGGIAAAKTGLLKLAGKEPAKQVAKEVVQKSTTGSPPPYFFKLAEKIKMMGDDATATTDRTIAKTLKSKDGKSTYVLEEDVSTGDTIIKKVNKEGDEMMTDVEIMELKKGEVVMGKDGRPVKVPDEYEEVTEVNARIEGDTFNDPYFVDGIKIDEIMKEVGEQAPSIKKAGGGIARLGYQMGGDVAYDATDSIYGSSAITVTPDTVMDQFGNQVQSELGNNFNKPLIPQVTEQASKQEGIMNSSPVISQAEGTGEIDMPVAGGNNNQMGILPVEPVNQLPGFRDDTPTKMPGGPPPEEIKYNDPLPQDQLMSGFAEWKRNNPDKVSNIGTQAIKYMTLPNGEQITFSGGAEASNMARYLESIGQPPMTPGNQNFKPIGDPNAKLEMALASGGIARMLGE